jgi:class 3 adenylate cyclase
MMLIKNLLLKAILFFIGILGRLLALYIIFFFLVFLLSLIRGAAHYPAVQVIMKIERTIEGPAVSFLQNHLSTKYGGTDYSSWIFVGTVVLVWFAVESRKARLTMKARALQQAWRDEACRRAEEQAERDAAAAPSDDPVQAAISGANREKLLELYTQTKRSLESQKQHLAFLAMDIMNSTGMKVGEDPVIAERDFRQYKLMVEGVIRELGGLKAAWTPDGVMICFPNVASAVKAAQSVINKLGPFNRNVKTMKSDFKIRAGINAGTVMFDVTVPMEEMSSREIDIAGHMQKYAGENTVYIDMEAIQSAGHDFGFIPANREIDGRQVYEWRPARL